MRQWDFKATLEGLVALVIFLYYSTRENGWLFIPIKGKGFIHQRLGFRVDFNRFHFKKFVNTHGEYEIIIHRILAKIPKKSNRYPATITFSSQTTFDG
jgi:hypothetical protein